MDWEKMTNDQVLDAWHKATVSHRTASGKDLDKYMKLRQQGESAAIGRFGLGDHMKAYNERFPDEAD